MTPSQKQIALVRNLLALSQSPFPAEADEAKKKAGRLSAKWGVTQAHLAPAAPPKCPGCLGCQPMRAGVVVVEVQYTTGTTTNSTFTQTYA